MRYEDWPERLNAEVQKARGKAFVWGTCDCALWALEVVAALTGTDHVATVRGTYESRDGALRCLASNWGCGLEDAVTILLGEPLPTPLYAQRGDVVSIGTDDGPALGICLGAELAFLAQEGGLTLRPITEAGRAWRV